MYVLSGQLGAGGVPKVIYNVTTNLRESVDEIRIAYLGGNDDSVTRFRDAGLEVECLGEKFPDVRHPVRLNRSLREFEPDIVHTHMGAASLLGRSVGQLRDTAIVSTMHNLYRERAFAARAMDYPTSPLADAIVSVSRSVQKSLPERFGIGTRSTVIHNCIDVDAVVRRGRATGDDVAWATDIPEGPLVACVARMSEKKGQHHLIRAFQSVLEEYSNAQLALTGWSDYKRKLIELAKNLDIDDHVHFLGKVPNPYTVYSAADVIAFPSKFEGFSIGMLEAMAFGKPIVATGIGPFREALGADHEYATPEHPPDLADLIVTYLSDDDLAAERGRKAKNRVRNKFSGSVGAEKHYQLYQELRT